MAAIDWNVYLVRNCSHTDPPKDKFIIAFQFTFGIFGFFINSRKPKFVKKQKHLLPCFVDIKLHGHDFLSHNSIISCNVIYPYSIDDLYQCVGIVDDKTREDVIKAINACKTLEIKYKNEMLSTYGYLYSP